MRKITKKQSAYLFDLLAENKHLINHVLQGRKIKDLGRKEAGRSIFFLSNLQKNKRRSF